VGLTFIAIDLKPVKPHPAPRLFSALVGKLKAERRLVRPGGAHEEMAFLGW
jgi:hypothetical protein